MAEGYIVRRGGGKQMKLPDFEYTGSYQLLDDGREGGTQHWRIKFLTSGAFTPAEDLVVDAFCVGGGGTGCFQNSGAGGYTTTVRRAVLKAGTPYIVTIGAGSEDNKGQGGTTTFDVIAKALGGYSCAHSTMGSSGGTGGTRVYNNHGASDGADGAGATGACGRGQGTTTREFGEPTGDLYAGSGASGTDKTKIYYGGDGGGGSFVMGVPYPGEENTGGGGAGNGSDAVSYGHAYGGSGIVVIRNHRG